MNPYQPPQPIVAPAAGPWRHPFVLLMIGFATGHMFAMGRSLYGSLDRVATGSIRHAALLASVVACLLLYTAVFQMAARLARADKLFIAAAIVFGLAILGLTAGDSLYRDSGAGVAGAVLGFCLARAMRVR